MMDIIADILLVAGALGVAFYCFVLSRRLTRFTDLERGVGGAVAVLSAQVDDLNRALEKARIAAENSGVSLKELTERADGVARRLELHVASMHDLPAAAPASPAASAASEPVPYADVPTPAAPEALSAAGTGDTPSTAEAAASPPDPAPVEPSAEEPDLPSPARISARVTPSAMQPVRSFFSSQRTNPAVSQ